MFTDEQCDRVYAQLLKLAGDAFQARFSALMENHYGSDFQRLRPHGRFGDQGYDGYLASKKEVFACYGALDGRAKVDAQRNKIRSDFKKAKEKYDAPTMQRWCFVHNLVGGFATNASAEIEKLQAENPEIAIRSFGLPEFLQIWPHEALHAPRLQRPKKWDQIPQDDRDWMDPCYPHIPLLGREEMFKDLQTWLLQGQGISVRVLVATGGSGKTRLAWDLCRWAAEKEWDAGFLKQDALQQILGNSAVWRCYQPTLLVIDYAAFAAKELHTWLLRLTEQSDNPIALRILLLERHAQLGEGWWEMVFNAPGSDADNRALQKLLNPAQPVILSKLTVLQTRREILSAVLAARGGGLTLPDDPQFNGQLENLSWGGEPLFLIMAALLAAKVNLSTLLSFSRTELVMQMAAREITRLRRFAGRRKERAEVLCRLAACATLAGGLSKQHIMTLVKKEKKALGYPSAGDPGAFANWLHEALPGQDGSIAPILPDLLGEAVLLTLFKVEDFPTVARTFDLVSQKTAEFLVRCVQDYTDPSHPEQYNQPINWLARLIRRPELSLEQVIELSDAMPLTSIAMKELAPEVLQSMIIRLREEIKQGQRGRNHPLVAVTLSNLGVSLNALGRSEKALQLTEEGVEICRELAACQPDVYRPDLAKLLNNLGNRQDDLGHHNEALQSTEEALQIWRTLAGCYKKDDYQSRLAMFLNNLGNRQANLGHHDKAMQAIEEAVEIRRELADRHPDVYRSDLASSLHNLGCLLADYERHEEALQATKEAVEIWKELAARRPDTHQPNLANSLNVFSDRLHAMDRHAEAHAAAQKAVELLSPCFIAMPQAYRDQMIYICNDYLARCHDAGVAPDDVLLQPIWEKIQASQQDDAQA
ncbi:MAG: tetratricopeptide repeat protein [Magnetococcales bacterium]|nr:tetratricopeptide repeat protein [Magnetococcales bacterium]MBF0113569.1 tetratricopeptide repeat protein [Magnetococcales bacterium]